MASRPMEAECIFSRTHLVTDLTNVTRTVDMFRFYVILQTLPVLALIVALKALEYSAIKTSHQGGYFSIQSSHVGNLKTT